MTTRNLNGPLSKREKMVAELLMMGLSTKEIANRLGIGKRTVEDHRFAVFKKKRVRNAVELLRLIMGMTNERDDRACGESYR